MHEIANTHDMFATPPTQEPGQLCSLELLATGGVKIGIHPSDLQMIFLTHFLCFHLSISIFQYFSTVCQDL